MIFWGGKYAKYTSFLWGDGSDKNITAEKGKLFLEEAKLQQLGKGFTEEKYYPGKEENF